MSSEDENYVTVTVEARGREVSVPCREAVVVTKRAGGALGPALHVGDIGPGSFTVLAEAAVSELVSLGANPHKHAGSVQITDLDARREIRDMAVELGVDADF